MPLIKNTLKSSLQEFADDLYPFFIGKPVDVKDLANKWSKAIDTFSTFILPPSTTLALAKAAFINVMLQTNMPLPDKPWYGPFMLGYKSPEAVLNLFNNYLNQVGYTPNPALNHNAQIAILQSILAAYNKLYPSRALTSDDIKYNQAFFNAKYANEIAAGTVIPLSTNPAGDGIIGEQTIKYKPFPDANVSPILVPHNSGFKDKLVGTPAESGNVYFRHYINFESKVFLAENRVYYDFIKKGKCPDYTKNALTQTLTDIDAQVFPLNPSAGYNYMSHYIFVYEKNHQLFNPIWVNFGFKKIADYNTYKETVFTAFANLPSSVKDADQILSNALKIYTTQLAAGMAPTFTGVPPPIPIDLSSVKTLGLSGGTAQACMDLLSDIILNWFKTGTAVNNSSGATITWN